MLVGQVSVGQLVIDKKMWSQRKQNKRLIFSLKIQTDKTLTNTLKKVSQT
jgi:hypothetical protein